MTAKFLHILCFSWLSFSTFNWRLLDLFKETSSLSAPSWILGLWYTNLTKKDTATFPLGLGPLLTLQLETKPE